jgi:hypothetical protein
MVEQDPRGPAEVRHGRLERKGEYLALGVLLGGGPHVGPPGVLAEHQPAERAKISPEVEVLPSAEGEVGDLEGVAVFGGPALPGRDLLAGVGEVAVAVAIDVEGVAVLDQPDAVGGAGADDDQGVARRLAGVGRLPGDGAVDRGQAGRGRRGARSRERRGDQMNQDRQEEGGGKQAGHGRRLSGGVWARSG